MKAVEIDTLKTGDCGVEEWEWKTVKIVKQNDAPPGLYEFAKKNLPKSLTACLWGSGSYSYTRGVRAGKYFFGTRVAEFDDLHPKIKVLEVGYLSDMTDLAQNYERCTGIEVTVVYNEGFIPLDGNCNI